MITSGEKYENQQDPKEKQEDEENKKRKNEKDKETEKEEEGKKRQLRGRQEESHLTYFNTKLMKSETEVLTGTVF